MFLLDANEQGLIYKEVDAADRTFSPISFTELFANHQPPDFLFTHRAFEHLTKKSYAVGNGKWRYFFLDLISKERASTQL